jgi:hypothetical protein
MENNILCLFADRMGLRSNLSLVEVNNGKVDTMAVMPLLISAFVGQTAVWICDRSFLYTTSISIHISNVKVISHQKTPFVVGGTWYVQWWLVSQVSIFVLLLVSTIKIKVYIFFLYLYAFRWNANIFLAENNLTFANLVKVPPYVSVKPEV